jgi:hypothetical protein
LSEVIVTKDLTFEFEQSLRDAGAESAMKAARETAESWRANIQAQNAVDTGAYRDSIYTNAPGGPSYETAVSKATAAASKGGKHPARKKAFIPLPKKKVKRPGNRAVYYASSCDAKAHLVEFGTTHTPARAAAIPAAQKAKAEFLGRAEEIMNRKLP